MKELFERVSIRKYQERPVEREKITVLLRAAMAAPSAGNQQPWEFYVVTDRGKIRALSQASPYAGCAENAPVVIVSVYRDGTRFPPYVQIDMSIAMENLWLACTAEGLGGVWLGIAPLEERMEAVDHVLGLPEDQHAFALFPLGYSAETRIQQDRFDEGRIHFVE